MRFLIVGAGAVGATLGIALEHQKHEVTYVVRPGRKAGLTKLFLVDARTEKPWKRERPNVVELGGELPPFEWCLVCTRGDQAGEALEAIVPSLRPDAKIGIAAATHGALAPWQARYAAHPIVRIMPAWAAWSDGPNLFRYLKPPLVKTLLTGEGDAAGEAAAGELAPVLEAAGFPARAVEDAHTRVAPALEPGLAMLAGWELAAWDVDALARDGNLRRLVSDAMAEVARLARPEARGVAWCVTRLPPVAFGLALRALPRVTSPDMRTMWRQHGPKIATQTRRSLDEILARGGDAPRLRELRARLPEIVPPPPPLPPEPQAVKKVKAKKPVEEDEDNV